MVESGGRPTRRGAYWMEVYGCQMNVSDSEIIRGILESAGYRQVDDPGDADAVLVVTCAVREHAETRAIGRLTQLGAGTGGEGRPVTVVCGCVAQEHGSSLLENYPAIDIVVGPDRYLELPDLIRRGRASATGFSPHHYEGVEPVRKTFPRSFVTVMRGCDNFCSYCIVPHVRGRERSRPAADILREVSGLVSSGYGEITLLGQNVNSYRSGELRFPELLGMVSREARGAWVRFVTSHPRDLTDDLVETMSRCRNVCRQIHLPVQSGSDCILSAMNRGYSRAGYLDKIRKLREAMPGIALSTDMIAGFPGESEEDFELSASLLEEVRFDQAFLFRYSERAGTPAASMEGSIPVEVRLERLSRLQDIQRSITRARSAALSGREMPVLIIGPGAKRGLLQTQGRTAGNRVVVFEGRQAEAGRFVLARIGSSDGWTHFADLVRPLGTEEGFEASESWRER